MLSGMTASHFFVEDSNLRYELVYIINIKKVIYVFEKQHFRHTYITVTLKTSRFQQNMRVERENEQAKDEKD